MTIRRAAISGKSKLAFQYNNKIDACISFNVVNKQKVTVMDFILNADNMTDVTEHYKYMEQHDTILSKLKK